MTPHPLQVESELDAAEEKEHIEAAGGDALNTSTIMTQLFREQTMASLTHQRTATEQKNATAAMLRTRLTAKLTGIEGELRSQSAADSVIMQSLAKLEENMVVRLESLFSIQLHVVCMWVFSAQFCCRKCCGRG